MSEWIKRSLQQWKSEWNTYREPVAMEEVKFGHKDINATNYLLTKIADILYIIACGITEIGQDLVLLQKNNPEK